MAKQRKITIGFLVFDGIQALDLFGPFDAFAEANSSSPHSECRYELIIVSEHGKPVTTEGGVVIQTQVSIDNCPKLHTLVIPGGAGTRNEKISQRLIDWIVLTAATTKRVCSVCTGLFILARTGLLEGRAATTHWNFIDEISLLYPSINIQPDALYIKDGRFITAAGITAGIDMTLSLIEEDMGPKSASAVARMLVMFFRRPGGQNQFSSFLQQQEKSTDRFADLIAWIADNLTEDLSTRSLAARVYLGERQFTRKFKEIYGTTPSRNVERIRIDVAKDWLLSSSNSIATISQQTGFKSADSFRRSFERVNGIGPSEYRSRFGHCS